jgi:hypothetical protein
MTKKDQWVLSPKGESDSRFRAARPGAGERVLELTQAQAVMLAAALECYHLEVYSSSDDYDPKPLEELRVMVDELATMGPPL